jgi:hypothetical protein
MKETEKKVATHAINISGISLVSYFEEKNGKTVPTRSELVIPINDIFQLTDSLVNLCQDISNAAKDIDASNKNKASASQILNAIDKTCDGECEGCNCKKSDLEKSVGKVFEKWQSSCLSGIVEPLKTTTIKDEYAIIGNIPTVNASENKVDFSNILTSLEKYVQKKGVATFRQISKAFYDRTRSFFKTNNISDEGFTMEEWRELFRVNNTELITKYGLYVNSVGSVSHTFVGKFVKPAGSISG